MPFCAQYNATGNKQCNKPLTKWEEKEIHRIEIEEKTTNGQQKRKKKEKKKWAVCIVYIGNIAARQNQLA